MAARSHGMIGWVLLFVLRYICLFIHDDVIPNMEATHSPVTEK